MQKSSLYYLYKKIRYAQGLVNRGWYFRVKSKNYFSKKIKVGFGPVTTGEDDLAVRKWRIDPIIDEINKTSQRYSAGFFFKPDEIGEFDVIVIVKNFSPAFFNVILELKKSGKKFIYDIVDNPRCTKEYQFYYAQMPEFLGLMDGFILSNPLQETRIKKYSQNYGLIEHPIISRTYKQDYPDSDEINILAQGYAENLALTEKLLPIITRISVETGKKINLIYHSNQPPKPNQANLKYVPWSVKNCFSVMAKADMAVSIKDLGDVFQREKPATKITAFMAAGLPVICTPTEADKLVIAEGQTGFFAYDDAEWYEYLKKLAGDAGLRKTVGLLARKYALENFNIKKITQKYINFFDGVV